jgi:hypothetical protein
MKFFRKLARFIVASGALAWREGPSAVLDEILSLLRFRLGIDTLNARSQAMEQKINGLVSTWTVTSWIEQAVLEKTPLVSVILPTHNRSNLLRRAVDSVCAQIYPQWEIVIVDDGSTDDTPVVVEQLHKRLGEDHLRILRIAHSGVCAARNHGLAEARGELIAYLDDDNFMHPLWLKAVVWGFLQRPDVDVVYGGIIIDDTLRVNRQSAGDLPSYHLQPYNRQRLIQSNLADISGVAHRSGLPEACFDEGLREMGDWDLLVRLTRDKAPLMIPAVSCFYYTTAPDRLSGGPTYDADAARVREKAR